jgi:hypothetical protein
LSRERGSEIGFSIQGQPGLVDIPGKVAEKCAGTAQRRNARVPRRGTHAHQLEEISTRIKEEIRNYSKNLTVDDVDRGGFDIARIYGMRGAMAMEMLEFETGVYGLALNLEEDSVGAVILGNYLDLHEGGKVRRTGRVL